MPQKRIGIVDTLKNPHCDQSMLGCNLIVVLGPVERRYGDAKVIGIAKGHRVFREQGVAVVISSVHGWAAKKIADHNAVPDPVCVVVTMDEPVSPVLVKACKKRGAELVVIREGFAAVVIATNETKASGTVLEVLSEGKKPKKPKRIPLKRTKPKAKPVVVPVKPAE